MDISGNQSKPRKSINKIKQASKSQFLLIVISIAAVFLVGFITYLHEHSKLSKVQTELTQSQKNNKTLKSEALALNKRVSSLTSQVKSQTKSNNTATTQTKTLTQTQTQASVTEVDNLSIKVLGAYKYYTTKYPNNPYIVIDVTIKNTGASSLVVPVSSFKLTDSYGNNGVDYGELAGTNMPNGKTILGDQTLSAGQEVAGGLTFSPLSPNYSLFTLSYKDQAFSVNATTSVNQ